MGSFSNVTELELLDHIVGKGSYTMPAAVAIGLCTADPTDAGTGASCNECTAASYERVAAAAAAWEVAAAGATQTATDLTFPEAAESWGVITHFGIFDGTTKGAGVMLAHGALTASKTIDSGDTPKFAAGAIDITLD